MENLIYNVVQYKLGTPSVLKKLVTRSFLH